MQGICFLRPLSLATLGLFGLASAALAGGGMAASPSAADQQVIARVTFRCNGGVVVQVAQMAQSARVTFAGQTQTLDLTPNGGELQYQNNAVAWYSDGKISYMRDSQTGQLKLGGCRQVKG